MSAWTPELKQKAIDLYNAEGPTPETSTEIVKSVAEQLEQSPNAVRMVLIQAGVYQKKAVETSSTSTTKSGEGSKRVSKESQIEALASLIKAKGKEADMDILSKLTGKAATYLVEVFGE